MDRAQPATVQRSAAFGLVTTGDPDAIDDAVRESLVRVGESQQLRLGVLDLLAMSHEAQAYPHVVKALRDGDSFVRFEAARVLALSVDFFTAECLGEDVRMQARKVPALDDIAVLDALVEVARNNCEETRTRDFAREALRKSGNPKAIQALDELGKEPRCGAEHKKGDRRKAPGNTGRD